MHDVDPHLHPTVIREMIRPENDVTNHRIMWLLIGQGLIASAYVGAGSARDDFVSMLAPVGILVALSAFVILYKSYQARGDLDFLGDAAKRGTLLTEFFLLLGLGFLGGGCAAPSGTASPPKPGSGIAEYRQVASQAHRSVADVVDALAALARSTPPPAAPRPELAGFDRAFRQLELDSVKARARAEAIIARGQAYFDEWKEQLAGMTNQPAAAPASGSYDRLFEHFGRVRQRSGDVREEFRPFMTKLREFRARLDKSPIPADGEAFRKELDSLTAHGLRVLQTLESISTALDAADVEWRRTLASKP